MPLLTTPVVDTTKFKAHSGAVNRYAPCFLIQTCKTVFLAAQEDQQLVAIGVEYG